MSTYSQLPAPVKAIYVASVNDSKEPGSFTYYVNGEAKVVGLLYRCPCGCGRLGGLPFGPKSEDDIKHSRATWDWNGNREVPTLTPSIHHVNHWHGFLTDGMWIQA